MSSYSVYIDEGGQTINDKDQPLICLAGVITKENEKKFEEKIRDILIKYDIQPTTEIHANEIMGRKPPFENLTSSQKQELLCDVLEAGCKNVEHFHISTSLKPYIKTFDRESIKRRGKLWGTVQFCLSSFASFLYV